MKQYKNALVIGGSRGVGKELVLSLSEQNMKVTAVARSERNLEKLRAETPEVQTIALDATATGVANKLMADIDPDLLILTVGYEPKMLPFHQLTWEDFSGAWNTDTRIAHAFSSAALTQPMKDGGLVISFSSGAGLSGSRLSGGYAGAKRMQHFLSDYAQTEADLLGLDLSFYSIIPKQLIEDSVLGVAAGQAYSNAVGKPLAQFFKQWDEPVTAAKIAKHVMTIISRPEPLIKRVFEITGNGMESAS